MSDKHVCLFVEEGRTPDGRFELVCQQCQRPKLSRSPANKTFRKCDGPELPPLIVRFGRLMVALARWKYHGSPVRSEEQMDQLLMVCERCPHFTGTACAHPDCGCAINDVESWRNKLYLATENCPDSPSRWQHLLNRCDR